MPISYLFSDPKKANPNTVYIDNPLPLEYALAHRKKAHEPSGKGSKSALVFTAQNQEDAGMILQILQGIQQKKLSMPPRIPSSLVQQGYFGKDRKPTPEFAKRITDRARPRVEVIMENAVLVVDKEGMAFVHSKGDEIDKRLMQFLQQEFWLKFYDKKGTDEEKKQLVQESAHFHSKIKQQKNDYDGVSWALANLDLLSKRFSAEDSVFREVKKMSRDTLVKSINGQLDPRVKGKRFDLRYQNERQAEKVWVERRKQLDLVKTQHTLLHEKAKKKEKEFKKAGTWHEFRQKHAWVKVCLADPPKYTADKEALNKFKSTRKPGVVNQFEVKEKSIVIESTQGEVTYKERFTRIAEDLLAVLQNSDGKIKSPVVINSVSPSDREAECLAVFKKIFGETIEVKKVDAVKPSPSDPSAIRASAPK